MKNAIWAMFVGILTSFGFAAELDTKLPDPGKSQAIVAFDKPTFAASTAIKSSYTNVFGKTLYDSPVKQSDFTVTLPNFRVGGENLGDVYFNVWNSTRLGNEKYNTTYGDEFDLTVGWHRKVSDWVSLDFNAQWYALMPMDKVSDDIYPINARADIIKCPWITPYVEVRWVGSAGKKSPDQGWFGWAGIYRAQKLPAKLCGENLKLVADVQVGDVLSDGLCGKKEGLDFFQSKLSLSVPLHRGNKVKVDLNAYVRWVDPIETGPNRFMEKEKWVGGGGFTIRF